MKNGWAFIWRCTNNQNDNRVSFNKCVVFLIHRICVWNFFLIGICEYCSAMVRHAGLRIHNIKRHSDSHKSAAQKIYLNFRGNENLLCMGG